MTASATKPHFVAETLVKRFEDRIVLDRLDLSVESGETLAILGGSGSGKSTLLRILAGLTRPDGGSVRVFGREISRLSERRLNPVRRHIGYLFQDGALFDSLTVGENVAFALAEHAALSRREIRDRVEEALELTDMEGSFDRLPSELSGGMRKRVALSRVLAYRPEAVLYDEPTAGLDPINAATIEELIHGMNERFGLTSIVVTHDLSSARETAQRVAFLHGGRIHFDGTWDAVEAADLPEFRRFLEGRSARGEARATRR